MTGLYNAVKTIHCKMFAKKKKVHKFDYYRYAAQRTSPLPVNASLTGIIVCAKINNQDVRQRGLRKLDWTTMEHAKV